MSDIDFPLTCSMYGLDGTAKLVSGSANITDISMYRDPLHARTFIHLHLNKVDPAIRKYLFGLRGITNGDGPNIKMFFQLDWWHIGLENIWPGSVDDDPSGPIKTMVYTDVTDEQLSNSATLQRFLNTLKGSYGRHENLVAAITRDRFTRIG